MTITDHLIIVACIAIVVALEVVAYRGSVEDAKRRKDAKLPRRKHKHAESRYPYYLDLNGELFYLLKTGRIAVEKRIN